MAWSAWSTGYVWKSNGDDVGKRKFEDEKWKSVWKENKIGKRLNFSISKKVSNTALLKLLFLRLCSNTTFTSKNRLQGRHRFKDLCMEEAIFVCWKVEWLATNIKLTFSVWTSLICKDLWSFFWRANSGAKRPTKSPRSQFSRVKSPQG